MSPADIAVENVEAVLRGEITDPSPGTLAARVLAWADERAHGGAAVDVWGFNFHSHMAMEDFLSAAREIIGDSLRVRNLRTDVTDAEILGGMKYRYSDGESHIFRFDFDALAKSRGPAVTITVNGVVQGGEG